VSGVALMGVVPSGAYLAKKLLLDAADQSGQWWWTAVLQGGAVFTAGYVVLVLVNALRRPSAPVVSKVRIARSSQFAALALAIASLLLAGAALGPVAGELVSSPLAPKELATTLLVFLGGALLALALSRKPLFTRGDALRSALAPIGRAFEQGDASVRRWPSASLGVLMLAALFGWLLASGFGR
jgi:multicomponent Na+:H+ antiporter subunit D